MPITINSTRGVFSALVLALTTASAPAAWFGGGSYDGFELRFGSGVPGFPQVHNDVGATNVMASSAWLTGMLMADGGAPVRVTVFWAREDGGTSVAAWTAAEGGDNHLFGDYGSVQPFTPLSHQISVLEGSDYYYRYFATNTTGETGWSPLTATFRTPAPPTITNGAGAAVGVTAAVLNGALTSGLEAQVWLEHAQTAFGVEPVVTTTLDLGVRTVAGTLEVPNPFRITLSNLSPATGYAYRLKTQNAFGNAVTEWVWFTTHPNGMATSSDLGWSGGGSYDGYDMNRVFEIRMPGLGNATWLIIR